ncbi:hypothetical protein [Ekhidna sp.]|uniref:hypothetical protein n=1 Tax=Ekhidna sp. TaxID=2608089 RepID=UPI003B50F088
MSLSKRIYLAVSAVVFLLISGTLSAQQFSAGVNTETPNPNAVLHLVAPNGNQGLLIPSLTTAERNSMSLSAVDNGLLVFDSEENAFYFWVDPNWVLTTNTDNQDLANVLSQGADAGNNVIQNVSDPVNPQDVATKNYVDNQGDSDDQDLELTGTTLSLTNDPTSIDLTPFLDNTDNQNLSSVLASGNDAGAIAITNLPTPTNPADAATKSYVDSNAGLTAVTSADIVDGEIANADINAGANISWSKIDKTGANVSEFTNDLGFIDNAANPTAFDVSGSFGTGLQVDQVGGATAVDIAAASAIVNGNPNLDLDSTDDLDLSTTPNAAGDIVGDFGTGLFVDFVGGANASDIAGATATVLGNPNLDLDSTDDLDLTSVPNAAGDISGDFGGGLIIDANAVTSTEIQDGSIVDADVSDVGASKITYDNTTSLLTAIDAQAAIDEIDATIDAGDLTDDQTGAEVTFNNVASGLTATDVQGAIDEIDATVDGIGAPTAATTTFNNVASGLTATDVQGAIDEIDATIDAGDLTDDQTGAEVTFNNVASGLTATDVQGAIDEIDATIDAGDLTDDQTGAEVTFNNVASGLTATDVQGAIDEIDATIDAGDLTDDQTGAEVTFNNVASGLTATDVQGAIDEIDATVDGIGAPTAATTTFNNVASGLTATDVQGAIDEIDATIDAGDLTDDQTGAEVTFNNVASGLTATDVQGAIDEIDATIDAGDLTDDQTGAEVTFNNVASGLTATDVQGAIDEIDATIDAGDLTDDQTGAEVTFNNVASGLTATDVQGAIDEIDATVDGIGAPTAATTTFNNVASGLTATDVQGAIDEIDATIDAGDLTDDQTGAEVTFNNVASGLTATDVQGAIDEIDATIDAGDLTDDQTGAEVTFNNVASGLTATDVQGAIDEIDATIDAGDLTDDQTGAEVTFNNVASGLTATDVQGAIDEIDATIDAGDLTDDQTGAEVTFNNVASGLTATDVQGAIDEIDATIDAGDLTDDQTGAEVTFNNVASGLTATDVQGAIDEIDATIDAGDLTDDQTGAEVTFNNVASGLTATDVQAAIDEIDGTVDGLGTAASTTFNNVASGLTATDVQGAIDEIDATIDAGDLTDDQTGAEVTFNNVASGLTATDVQGAIDEIDATIDAGDLTDDQTGAEVTFNNVASGLTATDVQGAIDEIDATIDAGDLTDDQTGAEVTFNNVASGLTATDVQAAIDEIDGTVDGLGTAASTTFNNVASGLTATDVQGAIDEIDATIDAGDLTDDQTGAEVTFNNVASGLTATDVQGAIDEIDATIDAGDLTDDQTGAEVTFNNVASGLTATDVQAAIDEIDATIDAGDLTDDQTGAEVTFNNVASGLTATDVQGAIDEIDGTVDALSVIPPTTDAQIIVSNGTTPTAVTMSGDVTIDNAGLTTIGANAVGDAQVEDNITINTADNQFSLFDDINTANFATFELTGLTASQTYTLPDASGEIALVGAAVGDAEVADNITINTPDTQFTLFDDINTANTATLELTGLTAPQTYNLPDASGTLSLTTTPAPDLVAGGSVVSDSEVDDNITVTTADNQFSLFDDINTANFATFELTGLTASQTYTLPDASGEIALVGAAVGDAEVADNITINTPDTQFTLFDDINTANTATLELTGLTAPQTYNLPDASGTLSLTTTPAPDLVAGGSVVSDSEVDDNITVTTADNQFSLFDDINTANFATFELTGLTASQTYTLPDASGEIALVGAAVGDAEVADNITINTPDTQFTLFDDINTANTATLELTGLTAPQTYNLPDASGTLSLTTTPAPDLVAGGSVVSDSEVDDNITVTTADNQFSLFDDINTANFATFELTGLTASQTYTLPDASGEIALVGAAVGDAEVADNITINTPDTQFTLFDDINTANTATLELTGLTAPQTYNLPDASGTLALDGAAPNFQMGFVEDANSAVFGAGTILPVPAGKVIQVIDDGIGGGGMVAAATFNNDLINNRATLALASARGNTGGPAAVQGGDVIGEIVFNGHYGGALTNFDKGAGIEAVAANNWTAGNTGADLIFITSPATASVPTERMRITESGGVGIGTGTPVYDLHVYNTLDQAKTITVDAQGTQTGQLGAFILQTLGDGSTLVDQIGTNGWMIQGYGDAFSDATRQNDLSFGYFQGNVETSSILHLDGSGTVGIGTGDPLAPLQIGDNLGFAHFENATEGINGEAITNNLYPDYSNIIDNALVRMNADSSSMIFMDDGSISFMRIAKQGDAGAGVNVDLTNTSTELSSWMELNDDGSVQISGGEGNIIVNDGSNVAIKAGDGFGGGNGNGGLLTLQPGMGTGTGNDGLIIADGDLQVANGRSLVLEDGAASDAVGFRAPSTVTTGVIWELPNGDGTGGQVLSTDGGGILSWITPGSSAPYPFFEDPNTFVVGSTFGPDPIFGGNDYQLGVVSGSGLGKAFLSAHTYGGGAELRLSRTNGSQGGESPVLLGEDIGEIAFTGREANAGNYPVPASIRAVATDNYNDLSTLGTDLVFTSTISGTTTTVEAMRINGGFIGINNNSPNVELDVIGNAEITGNLDIGAGNIVLASAGGITATGQINANASSVTTAQYQISGVTVINGSSDFTANSLDVGSSSASITTGGDITHIGNYVTPPATAVAMSSLPGALPAGRIIRVNADGNITNILAGVDGQEIVLVCVVGGPNTIGTGGNVKLHQNTAMPMVAGASIHFVWIQQLGNWVEIGRAE